MPDQRTNQTVAERLELQLARFPNPLHRRRRWYTLAGGLIPLVFVGLFAARGDHTIFLSQSVAESHQYFQADCQTCHQTPWQPLIRLVSANPSAKSVHDHACHQCHDQRKDDHHTLAMAQGVPDCADCHLEHRGAIRLTDQADASCTKCHEPFENHPQFALLRPWPLVQKPSAAAEAKKTELQKVARLRQVDDEGVTSGRWVDKAALKFSHEGHLVPLVAGWTPGAGETVPPESATLNCADCHELDANGQFMQPIAYEKHCRQCHPLRFSRELDAAAGASPNEGGSLSRRERPAEGLPHESPEIVLSVMRQRLIDSVRRLRRVPPANPPSRLPNRQPTPAQREWDWVEEELRVLENAIFRVPVSDGTAHRSNACLKCHERGDSNGTSGFAIAPVAIPTRWMPHSQFRHDRHLNMQCTTCHHAAGAVEVGTDGSSQPNTLGSRTVQDILMPSQVECQACHGATSEIRSEFRPARKNCTECHQYHHVHFSKAADEQAPH